MPALSLSVHSLLSSLVLSYHYPLQGYTCYNFGNVNYVTLLALVSVTCSQVNWLLSLCNFT